MEIRDMEAKIKRANECHESPLCVFCSLILQVRETGRFVCTRSGKLLDHVVVIDPMRGVVWREYGSE